MKPLGRLVGGGSCQRQKAIRGSVTYREDPCLHGGLMLTALHPLPLGGKDRCLLVRGSISVQPFGNTPAEPGYTRTECFGCRAGYMSTGSCGLSRRPCASSFGSMEGIIVAESWRRRPRSLPILRAYLDDCRQTKNRIRTRGIVSVAGSDTCIGTTASLRLANTVSGLRCG